MTLGKWKGFLCVTAGQRLINITIVKKQVIMSSNLTHSLFKTCSGVSCRKYVPNLFCLLFIFHGSPFILLDLFMAWFIFYYSSLLSCHSMFSALFSLMEIITRLVSLSVELFPHWKCVNPVWFYSSFLWFSLHFDCFLWLWGSVGTNLKLTYEEWGIRKHVMFYKK